MLKLLEKSISKWGYVVALGELLEQLRRDKGLTQEQVGKYLNVTKTAVYGYECGRNVPPLESFKSLAILYNVNSDFLLERTDIQETWSDFLNKVETKDTSISAQDLIVKINALSISNRAIALKIIDLLSLDEVHKEM